MSSPERRKAKRRPILDTFSVFVVVPKKGMHRLPVFDISELGVGFELDLEGEDHASFEIKSGDELDFRFYLNQSLYIPLGIQVARLETKSGTRRVGAEFVQKSSENYKAFAAFLQMLDRISGAVEFDKAAQG